MAILSSIKQENINLTAITFLQARLDCALSAANAPAKDSEIALIAQAALNLATSLIPIPQDVTGAHCNSEAPTPAPSSDVPPSTRQKPEEAKSVEVQTIPDTPTPPGSAKRPSPTPTTNLPPPKRLKSEQAGDGLTFGLSPISPIAKVSPYDYTLLKGKPLGLVNSGTYCYSNSVIQALNAAIDVKELISDLGPDHIGRPSQLKWVPGSDYFTYYESIKRIDPSRFNAVSELTLLLKDLRNPSYRRLGTKYVNPADFQASFSKTYDNETHEWNGEQQQDAEEYYRHIMNHIAAGHQHPRGFLQNEHQHPAIEAMFGIENIVVMECNQESCRHSWLSTGGDPDWTLKLELPSHLANPSTKSITLDEFIQFHGAPDLGDGEMRCERCRSSGCSRTWRGIKNKSRVLPIAFFRGGKFAMGDWQTPRKLEYDVDLPEMLDERWTGSGQRYHLRTVVKHLGHTYKSGHYVAYTKTDSGWWLCNDTRVTKASFADVLTSHGQACIAFYQLVDGP